MIERADELIESLKNTPDDYALITQLKNSKHKVFFRVGVYNDKHKVIYDSHAKRRLGPKFTQEYVIDHPEVNEAYLHGVGTFEDYSEISEQKMYYLAKSFQFHGKTYVLRLALPYQHVVDFTENFEIGFLGLATAVLLLFSMMTWFIINHLTNPIQQIINAVRPYQEGELTNLPKIIIKSSNSKDDFGKLGETLNSLSEKIQLQIDSLTKEKNEKVAVLESLVEGVVAVDKDFVVTYVNNMALKFLETTKNELLNRPFETSNHPKCAELLKLCHEKGEPITEEWITKIAGRKVYLDIIAIPKKGNSGAILVLQDKSSHYRILEMRKDFIANASHELKTPITIIRGFAETLNDFPDLPNETKADITGKIVRNCERMTHLIKDLLTLADIEHLTESRLIEANLHEIVLNCCAMLHDAHPTAQVDVKLEKETDYHAVVDPQLIELAIINLLENAAKYSNPPAKITVSLGKTEENIKISVSDQGIGISKEDLENVFQRFYTVNKAHSQKMGGAGLGLSLVETIIDKHLGKISVASELGVGTTFTVTLPIERKVAQ
jgi:signal transduction histidine kinase